MTSTSTPPRDFLAVAAELKLLPAGDAERLAGEATRRGLSLGELVLRRGLLSPAQVDIVETLRRPDEVVPGYEILGLIGAGGMGVVYRARQKALGRLVALKTVPLTLLSDANVVGRFEQEAQVVARLAHPHIVTAYDFGRHEGRLYFAMELVEGEDAEQLIRRSAGLGESLAWSLIRQAAAGLAHAHQLGIVHRDIKPANLLLLQPPAGFPLPSGVPLVKIADFGLARLYADDSDRTRLTSTSSALGSPYYMAPEQLQGDAVDHRADIYALGASAWHMLVGQPPLAGKTMAQILTDKVAGKIPRVGHVRPTASHESCRLVFELMALDPAERPADYVEVIRRIDALPFSSGGYDKASGATTAGWSPGAITQPAISIAPTQNVHEQPTQTLPRPMRISRRLLIGGGVAVFLLTAVGATSGWLLWREPSPGERDLVPSGRSATLFNGLTIDGWLPESGGWYPGKNDDQATVIEGNGVIRRALPLPIPRDAPPGATAETPDHYSLTVYVQLHHTDTVEVHFDLQATDESAPRQVVLITRDGIQLGCRASERGELTPRSKLLPHVVPADGLHVVQIERHSRGWWITADEQLLGAVAAQRRSAGEFRVVVPGGGTAWISDVTLEELVPPVNEKPKERIP